MGKKKTESKRLENEESEVGEVLGVLTVTQAGRRGGSATLQNQGMDFFKKIGQKGGRRTAELYAAQLSEFGKKGGRLRRPTLDEFAREQDRH